MIPVIWDEGVPEACPEEEVEFPWKMLVMSGLWELTHQKLLQLNEIIKFYHSIQATEIQIAYSYARAKACGDQFPVMDKQRAVYPQNGIVFGIERGRTG